MYRLTKTDRAFIARGRAEAAAELIKAVNYGPLSGDDLRFLHGHSVCAWKIVQWAQDVERSANTELVGLAAPAFVTEGI